MTHGAVPLGPEERPDLAQAALWGLLRSAYSEHPDRFCLLDSDHSDASRQALRHALTSPEPQLAIRRGVLYTPRFARLGAEAGASAPRPFDSDGTVLITGGTGGLGALVARHLACEHGVRHLLLLSRGGLGAEGAVELQAELGELGCEAEIVACDVTDRARLGSLVAQIPVERPLTAVIHTAGTLDDGVIESLDAERLAGVMAPKVDGAINLHELTKDLPLCEFILFSSAAGALGGPGQGNYAAANAFLDALAGYRRARGLPGVSLAWGAWAMERGMTVGLSEGDVARWGRLGLSPLSPERGLELFDVARAIDEPLLLAVPLDMGVLRTWARAGMLPAILSGLVRVPARRAQEAKGSLARRLAGAPESEWDAIVLELVRGHVAGVLGHASAEAIDPQSSFKDLGFDSLSAVELRNGLMAATGVKLPATLVFDHPTPAAVAAFLRLKVEGVEREVRAPRRALARTEEPIAIVGMSCRYPGGVSSPAELWELAASGTDAIGEFPVDRGWDTERLYDPDPDHSGTSYTRHGGFLYDAGEFDAEFFNIGPREALAMDPQQRLLLECAWEVFEDAGIDPATLRASQTGVFTGVMYQDYGLGTGPVPAELEGHIGTGVGGSIVSGRLAYTFGLEGPAVTVDTACSSSLVAMHLACQALRQGECDLALAGGVTVLSNPGVFIVFSRQRGLAPDGRCKSFGHDADGVGWAEGAGLLALEPLSRARSQGHRVLALLRGSAVNQDGASNGLTAPNGPSQERVIAQALANAGLSPADVDAVEGHGTGTMLGDPIEAQALIAAYGQERTNGPLRLGSLKSNIGHTQAAAGVAGVIKMVEALRHGVLPRTLHAEEPSPHVDWSAGAVSLLSEPEPWPEGERTRRAGISSFGVSGTNAHVILEEAPREKGAGSQEEAGRVLGGGAAVGAVGDEVAEVAGEREGAGTGALGWPVVPFVLSAKSGEALCGQAGRLGSFLAGNPGVGLGDVGGSLALHRARLPYRGVVLAGGREGLVAGLDVLACGGEGEGVVRGVAGGGGKVAFLFTGQGAQWVGMGRELAGVFPGFAGAFEEVCGELDRYLERPLGEVVFAGEGSDLGLLLDGTEFAQPALFALEVALFRLVEGFGVRADYLVGHSVGELVAACVAGVFSLGDACALVAARGRLMGALAGGGAMLAVQASEGEVLESLADVEGVSLAAVNAPEGVVLSGEGEEIARLEGVWAGRGRRVRRLRVSHAFHSGLMEPMLEEFRGVVEGLSFGEPRIPIVSNRTGVVLSAQEAMSPDYWVGHVRDTVRFADGVASLRAAGVSRFLELGPGGVLSALVSECVAEEDGEGGVLAAGCLRARQPEVEAFVGFLARAYVDGVAVDWGPLFEGAERVELPRYAFQRKRYWLGFGAGSGDAGSLGQSSAGHPLLGASLDLAGEGEGLVLTGRLSTESHPWLADHAVMGTVLLPGTAFLELALAAAERAGVEMVEELTLQAPLVFAEGGACQVQVVVGERDGEGRHSLGIYSRPQGSESDGEPGEWVLHAQGVLGGESPPARDLEEFAAGQWPPADAQDIDTEFFYDRLAEAGYDYGPVFQGLRAAWRAGEHVYAEVALEEEHATQAQSYLVHPALLDASLHALVFRAQEDPEGGGVVVPFSFAGVHLYARGAGALRICLSGSAQAPALLALDESGTAVLTVDSIASRPVDQGQLRGPGRAAREDLFCMRWSELSLPALEGSLPRVVLVGGEEVELAGASLELERYPDLGALARAIDDGAAAPELVLTVPSGGVAGGEGGVAGGEGGVAGGVGEVEEGWGALASSVHVLAGRTLALLKEWLSDERFADSRLLLVTHGAVPLGPEERPDLAQAALWGLLRSAYSEHPDRFCLLDSDHSDASRQALRHALTSPEPQLAIRRGVLYTPRFARLGAEAGASAPRPFDSDGTVLITGGTGGLGALVARHLACEHGVRHLLLLSRGGLGAEGAVELQAELGELGCEAEIVACDVTDRARLGSLVAQIPVERPLTAVIHTAGTLDDGVIESLDAERLAGVMAPKVDGAINLHELTKDLPLCEFILFSSAAGALGGPGQGNYAAANAFLDALAGYRRARGLPGVSLAWGAWAMERGMTVGLSEGDVARWGRLGLSPLSPERGLRAL